MKTLEDFLFERECKIKADAIMVQYEEVMNAVAKIKNDIESAKTLDECEKIRGVINSLRSDVSQNTYFVNNVPQQEYDTLKDLGLL